MVVVVMLVVVVVVVVNLLHLNKDQKINIALCSQLQAVFSTILILILHICLCKMRQ